MDVAYVETVEGSAVGAGSCASLRWAGSTVLFSFSKLRNDGDTFQLLSSQLQSLGNGLFVLELNVANAGMTVSSVVELVAVQLTLLSDQSLDL